MRPVTLTSYGYGWVWASKPGRFFDLVSPRGSIVIFSVRVEAFPASENLIPVVCFLQRKRS